LPAFVDKYIGQISDYVEDKMKPHKKLGEIFLEQNILSLKTVERVIDVSKSLNKRFGTVLEEMGLITGEELAYALAKQYNCKMISNFADGTFSPNVLAIIPAEVALQNLLFPLKREGDKLALAMADPTNTKVVGNIAANNNLSIIPFVATCREINAAICKNYFGTDITEPTRKTVLVVDDDKVILDMISKILGKEYLVYTSIDGMEAYKEALSKKPHVILTDKEMPKLDGYKLINSLRNLPETKTIPTILISATSSIEEELKAFEAGFFDFIQKPINPSILLARVKRAFDFSEKKHYLFMH
jgi:CheY-like chemotaxis protein